MHRASGVISEYGYLHFPLPSKVIPFPFCQPRFRRFSWEFSVTGFAGKILTKKNAAATGNGIKEWLQGQNCDRRDAWMIMDRQAKACFYMQGPGEQLFFSYTLFSLLGIRHHKVYRELQLPLLCMALAAHCIRLFSPLLIRLLVLPASSEFNGFPPFSGLFHSISWHLMTPDDM